MLSKSDKIDILISYLDKVPINYADSFKGEVAMHLTDYLTEEKLNDFLTSLADASAIKQWADQLLSQIVLKYDQEFEQLSDFIYYYISERAISHGA